MAKPAPHGHLLNKKKKEEKNEGNIILMSLQISYL